MSPQSRDQRRPRPTVGPTTEQPGRDGRAESMADPDVHDGAARAPDAPEPPDRSDSTI